MSVLLSHYVVPFFFFFSHIWRFHPHIVQFQHHMWQFFSHVGWFPYFFLIFDGSILTLCSSNITFDNYFVIYSSSFIYLFLKFDGSIVILSSSNIASVLFLLYVTFFLSCVTCDSFFVTCHMWQFFLSYLVVPLLFSHIWRLHPHIVQFQYHMW